MLNTGMEVVFPLLCLNLGGVASRRETCHLVQQSAVRSLAGQLHAALCHPGHLGHYQAGFSACVGSRASACDTESDSRLNQNICAGRETLPAVGDSGDHRAGTVGVESEKDPASHSWREWEGDPGLGPPHPLLDPNSSSLKIMPKILTKP